MNEGGGSRDVPVVDGLKVYTDETPSYKRKENISNTRSSIATDLQGGPEMVECNGIRQSAKLYPGAS